LKQIVINTAAINICWNYNDKENFFYGYNDVNDSIGYKYYIDADNIIELDFFDINLANKILTCLRNNEKNRRKI